MGRRKGGFVGLINRILTAPRLGFATEPTFITGDRSVRPKDTSARTANPLALAGLVTLPLGLAACGYQPSFGDYRPVIDS